MVKVVALQKAHPHLSHKRLVLVGLYLFELVLPFNLAWELSLVKGCVQRLAALVQQHLLHVGLSHLTKTQLAGQIASGTELLVEDWLATCTAH